MVQNSALDKISRNDRLTIMSDKRKIIGDLENDRSIKIIVLINIYVLLNRTKYKTQKEEKLKTKNTRDFT